MIKAVALDDESLALQVLQTYCEKTDEIELVQVFIEQKKAIRYLNKFDVDLLFLDIQMPDLNGIDLYKTLKRKTKVIFTTAHSQYAIEGFNVSATDYLLKPISPERFHQAIEKVKRELRLEHNDVDSTHISIRADFKLHQIALTDILLIEALDDYVQIHLEGDQRLTARATMKGILKKLPQTDFKRVHRSFIVPIGKIKSVYKDVINIGNFKIPIGSTYKKDILKNL